MTKANTKYRLKSGNLSKTAISTKVDPFNLNNEQIGVGYVTCMVWNRGCFYTSNGLSDLNVT